MIYSPRDCSQNVVFFGYSELANTLFVRHSKLQTLLLIFDLTFGYVTMDPSTKSALIRRLSVDQTFHSLTNNQERVAYILDTVVPLEKIRAEVASQVATAQGNSAKSPDKAKAYQEEAELYFELEEWTEALTALNSGLLHVSGTEVALRLELYDAKAKAHFELKQYDGALWAIEQVCTFCNSKQLTTVQHLCCHLVILQLSNSLFLIGNAVILNTNYYRRLCSAQVFASGSHTTTCSVSQKDVPRPRSNPRD